MGKTMDEKEKILYYITTVIYIITSVLLILLLIIIFLNNKNTKVALTQNKNLLFSCLILSIIAGVSPLIPENPISIACRLQASFNYMGELNEKFFPCIYSILLMLLTLHPNKERKLFDLITISLTWIISVIFAIVTYTEAKVEVSLHFCRLASAKIHKIYIGIAVTITAINITLLGIALNKVLSAKKRKESEDKSQRNSLTELVDEAEYQPHIAKLSNLIVVNIVLNIPNFIQLIEIFAGVNRNDDPFWLVVLTEIIYCADPLVICSAYIIDGEVWIQIKKFFRCGREENEKEKSEDEKSYEFTIENIFDKPADMGINGN